eukprot:CAMPEP_0174729508 /NCGR_PEP_ID=MMETSP1094-20130205/53850_1 /TAXON_ID=156173 /ORGANISM="Chrysochromulina brevifilum, Strain UTEX LB 985" /LENGTH=77 /DNA_ID=CAMNT_0015931631 /DNA_START=75 /DNA_END=308 /DNA_ORIENTATION=+
MADEEDEEIVEQEPEKTPEEKIEELKLQLQRGEIGPFKFDLAFSKEWAILKPPLEEDGNVRLKRQNTRGGLTAEDVY